MLWNGFYVGRGYLNIWVFGLDLYFGKIFFYKKLVFSGVDASIRYLFNDFNEIK